MIKIVTYNIQFGQGRDGKVDLGRIIDSVKGADLIALQEVDRFWPRSGEIDQVREIINAFESYDYAYGQELIRLAVRLILRVGRFADSLAIFCSAGNRLPTEIGRAHV